MELMAAEPRTQVAGVTVVVDAAGYKFKHMRAVGLEDYKISAAFLQVRECNCYSRFGVLWNSIPVPFTRKCFLCRSFKREKLYFKIVFPVFGKAIFTWYVSF